MQLVQAGEHKLILLEYDLEFLQGLIRQTGFEFRLDESKRAITLELQAPDRQTPLLLFDAADPGNLGWFSRCQFYVDGVTGLVLQTPIQVANFRDRTGRVIPTALKIQISKELPENFRMPGKQAVSEQVVYAVLFNFLNAILTVGVAVCGGNLVKPLAGRTEGLSLRG